MEPPVFASPKVGETLFIYFAVSDVVVSAVLFKESEDGRQRPMFFVSKSLANSETTYNHLEQAALALWIATKKLGPYFQAHPIVVLTNLPLRSTLHKPNLSGRMARWAIELSEYGILYKPRLAKKGKVLADFLAEVPQPKTSSTRSNWWTLTVDRASRKTGAGIGLQLKSPGGDKIEQAIRLGFNVSNNESEYKAILSGIELAVALYVDKLIIRSDSQLVVAQVNAEYESWDPRMAKYVTLVKQRLASFSTWKLEHVPKDSNERADALVVVAASLPITKTIFLPVYYQPDSSIATIRVSQVGETSHSWMDPIAQYINTGELPNEKDQAHKV